MVNMVVAGNCQAQGVAACLQMLIPDICIYTIQFGQMDFGNYIIKDFDESIDIVAASDGNAYKFFENYREKNNLKYDIIKYPAIYFSGFHPDSIYNSTSKDRVLSPTGTNHSAIIAHSFMAGYSAKNTFKLFNERVFNHLGYFDYYDASISQLLEQSERCGFDIKSEFTKWSGSDPYFYTPNHPKLKILSSFAQLITRKLGHDVRSSRVHEYIEDPVQHLVFWPLYPEIGKRLNMEGDYCFKLYTGANTEASKIKIYELEQYIDECFEAYSDAKIENMLFTRDLNGKYNDIYDLVFKQKKSRKNPYAKLPKTSFWKRAVRGVQPGDLDPVIKPKFLINESDRVSTAGSCFAQHIAKNLTKNGFNYFITDNKRPDGVRADIYEYDDMFSARFGNIYSTRQLLQLLKRAYGDANFTDDIWQDADGHYLDAYRPQIVTGGYLSEKELLEDRKRHLASVRRMFEESDVLVFTLGLTETWCSKIDGKVVPIAPGVVTSEDVHNDYVFHNFTVEEIQKDMSEFIEALQKINPNLKILLTVSPVPLIATYEQEHVLTATTYSKSVLRVAANYCAKKYDNTDYFPSYEIITGNYNHGSYYADDLREILPQGVDHVMRCFFKHYVKQDNNISENKHKEVTATVNKASNIQEEIESGKGIICDEVAIVKDID